MLSKKKSLISSMLVMIIAAAVAVGAVAAWWIESIPNSASAIIKTGDTGELDIKLYMGIDFNYDGDLDVWTENNEPVDLSLRTFPEIITNMYHEQVKELTPSGDDEYANSVNNIYAGRQLVYKMVIRNDLEKSKDTDVSVFLSKLTTVWRMMFKVRNISLISYDAEKYDTENSGYFNGSNLDSEWLIQEPDISEHYVWNISDQQEFIVDAHVKKGYVMELGFNLLCLGPSDMREFYNTSSYRAVYRLISELDDLGANNSDIAAEIRRQTDLINDIIYELADRQIAGGTIDRTELNAKVAETLEYLDGITGLGELATEIIQELKAYYTAAVAAAEITKLVAIDAAYQEITARLLTETSIKFHIDCIYVRGKYV